MIVDDDTTCRMCLAAVLKSQAEVIYESPSAEHCLRTLKVDQPDLHVIFIDINLEGISGIAAIRKIRELEKYKKTPIIACSSDSKKAIVIDTLKAGASNYIVKPFLKETVIPALEKIFTSH